MENVSPVYVALEFTPNPNTLKYSVNRTLLKSGALNLTDKTQATEKSQLGSRLFGVDGVTGVMIGREFVTITKSEHGQWDLVHKTCSALIEDFLNRGLPAVEDLALDQDPTHHHGSADTDVEKKILAFLDSDIRPAVAQDGGDITFQRFENGIVYLELKGSCSGCPSSTMTLKMGIEKRLCELLPEVKEVVATN